MFNNLKHLNFDIVSDLIFRTSSLQILWIKNLSMKIKLKNSTRR